MKYIIGLAMALMFIPACSGEDAELSPPEKCEVLISKVCDILISCGEYTSQSACGKDFVLSSGFTCNDVVEVRDSYDRCMSELDYLTCSDVMMPFSCHKILIYE